MIILRRMISGIAIIATLAAVFIGGAGCESFFNDIADEPYRIVFASNRDGNFEIYVMDPDGFGQTRLTIDPAFIDDMPKPSPDGSQIVFSKDYTDVYTMNADGSDVSPPLAAAPGCTANPSWSPDGRYIIYQKTLAEVHIMNPDGTGDALLITANDPNVANWSARRNLIAFRAYNATNYDIFISAPYSGAAFTNLTNNPSNDESSPSWSPDGSKLVYAKRTGVGGGYYHLYLWDFASGISSPFFDSGTFSYTDDAPSFSPDGEKIVFHSNCTGTNQIYVINADGTGLQRLTFTGTNQFPAWVP